MRKDYNSLFNKSAWLFIGLLFMSLWTFSQPNYDWKTLPVGGGGYVTGVKIHPTVANVVYCRTDVGGVYRWEASTETWTQLFTVDRMPPSIINASNVDGTEQQGNGTGRKQTLSVGAIALDPQNADILYVAAGNTKREDGTGYFLKSTDRGENFVQLPLSVGVFGNRAERTIGPRMAVDPQNSDVVYYGSNAEGVWRSFDGGDNWSQIPFSQIPQGAKIDNGKLFGGTMGIVFDETAPTNGQGRTTRVYLTVSGEGVYESTDAGQSWNKIFTGNYAKDMEMVNGLLYFAPLNEGVKKYTPGGSVIGISPPGSQIDEIAVDPNDNQVVYAFRKGMAGMYRSINAGTNWSTLQTNNSNSGRANFISPKVPWKTNSDVTKFLSIGDIYIDPTNSNRMWFSEGMGMWRSDNVSNTNNAPIFEDISVGIEEMVSNDIVVSTTGRAQIGVWDRLGFTYEPNAFQTIPSEQLGGITDQFTDGQSLEASPTDPDFMVAIIADHRKLPSAGSRDYSSWSDDGGATWTKFGSLIPESPLAGPSFKNVPSELKFGEAVISANNNDNILWKGRNGSKAIYYTTNRGDNWIESSIPSGAGDLTEYFFTMARTIAPDAVQQGTFYFYSYGAETGTPFTPVSPAKLYRSTDNGATFTERQSVNLPFRVFNGQLRTAPGSPEGHLWFCTGFDHRASLSERGLFLTTDGGDNFIKMPDIIDAWAVGFGATGAGQTYPTVFFYGETQSDGWGLYRSTDQGGNWTKIVDYPLGYYDRVNVVEGDPSVFGKVYLGLAGQTFVYGTPTNQNIPVTGVKIQPKVAELFVTETVKTTGFVLPSGASNRTVTYQSSNSSVASVDSNGLVTALASGTATITVTTQDGGETDQAVITVKNTVRVSSIDLVPNSTSVPLYQDLQMTGNLNPSNASIDGVTYTSSNPSVATIDANGFLITRQVGTTIITATSEDGGKTDQSTIEVTPPADNLFRVVDFDVFVPAIQVQEPGKVQMFVTEGSASVAIVANPSQSGINTSSQVGRYNKNGGGSYKLFGFLLPTTQSLGSFNKLSLQLYGNITEVYVQVRDASGAVIVDGQKSVISNNNWVTFTLNLPAGALEDAKTINVFPDPNQTSAETFYIDNVGFEFTTSGIPVTGVELTPATLNLQQGQTSTLSVNVLPSNASNKGVTFTSSNTNVATISAAGVVSATNPGTTNITVTTNDGGQTDVTAVTVTDSSNIAPTADAGSNQTVTDSDNSGSKSVSLNGSGSSDNDGSISSYAWTENGSQIATGNNPSVSLSVGSHTITLTVTDNDGATDTDDVVITVNAGSTGSSDLLEAENASYTGGALTSSASASNGQFVDGNGGFNISWSYNAASAGQATIKFAVAAPSGTRKLGVFVNNSKVGVLSTSAPRYNWEELAFTANLVSGNNTIELRDTESAAEPDVDYVKIEVGGGGSSNNAPTANAGSDQTVTDTDNSGSESVSLNGSGSADSDGTISSYVWTLGGSQIATGVSPSVSLSVGVNTVTLTVTDDDGATDTDQVVITVVAGQTASNLVQNPGFESDFANWNIQYGARSVVTSDKNSGAKSCKLSNGGGVEQTISGLSPNTAYTLKAYAKKVSGGFTLVGVKNAQIGQIQAEVTSSAWTQYSVNFTTGSNTSVNAMIYGGGGSISYFDDFQLTLASGAKTVAESIKVSEIRIFPNPANDFVTFYSHDIATLQIFNSVGQQVYTTDLSVGENELDLRLMSKGFYLVRISGNGIQYSEKLILK